MQTPYPPPIAPTFELLTLRGSPENPNVPNQTQQALKNFQTFYSSYIRGSPTTQKEKTKLPSLVLSTVNL
jgi:hypothetical protein